VKEKRPRINAETQESQRLDGFAPARNSQKEPSRTLSRKLKEKHHGKRRTADKTARPLSLKLQKMASVASIPSKQPSAESNMARFCLNGAVTLRPHKAGRRKEGKKRHPTRRRSNQKADIGNNYPRRKRMLTPAGRWGRRCVLAARTTSG